MRLADQASATVPIQVSQGGLVFPIPLLIFPGFWGFAYLVIVQDEGVTYRVLIDTGSGFGESNACLENGFSAISDILGKRIDLEDLTHVLITHGHIDHFGGLPYIRQRSAARLGVHSFDQGSLSHHEERIAQVSRRLRAFLIEAGVEAEERQYLLSMYRFSKAAYRSVDIDFTFESAGMRLGPFEMLHVPGHCPGQVVIRLGDVLFSGDTVLHDISPHQSPEYLTPFTGLSHYLRSLENLREWAKGIRLTLAGHQDPIDDLEGRIASLKEFHRARLCEITGLLQQPQSIAQLSETLFGGAQGYHRLLAVEETGAHVEYLEQRGLLSIENLREIDEDGAACPILYRSLVGIEDGLFQERYWES